MTPQEVTCNLVTLWYIVSLTTLTKDLLKHNPGEIAASHEARNALLPTISINFYIIACIFTWHAVYALTCTKWRGLYHGWCLGNNSFLNVLSMPASSMGIHNLHDSVHVYTSFLIPFWLIIMWDCTAVKMHLTQEMYVICTWDWQQNLTYVWYVAPSTQKSTLTCCYAPPTIYWLKGKKGLNLWIQVEHFSRCDRSDDISISGSEAPPTYWLS